ncbi:MAG: hypothetical protein J4432_01550 [DPANN group archaeon]|nr:hypothetical protein [DPANN group archaeon]
MARYGVGIIEQLIILASVIAIVSMVILTALSIFLPANSLSTYDRCILSATKCASNLAKNRSYECAPACAEACTDQGTGRDYWNNNEKTYDVPSAGFIDCPPGTACYACSRGTFR